MRRLAIRNASPFGRYRAFNDRSTANGRLSTGANISSTRAPGNVARSGSAPSTSWACQLVPSSDSTRKRLPSCSTYESIQRITSPSSGASSAFPLRSNTSARGSCSPSILGSPSPRQNARLISHCSSTASRRPDRQVVRQPGVRLVGADPHPLELGRAQHAPVVDRQRADQPANHSRGPARRLPTHRRRRRAPDPGGSRTRRPPARPRPRRAGDPGARPDTPPARACAPTRRLLRRLPPAPPNASRPTAPANGRRCPPHALARHCLLLDVAIQPPAPGDPHDLQVAPSQPSLQWQFVSI